MNDPRWSRVMQFCAGPERHTFYACEQHRAALDKGDVSCFLVLRNESVRAVEGETDEVCYFCQEG